MYAAFLKIATVVFLFFFASCAGEGSRSTTAADTTDAGETVHSGAKPVSLPDTQPLVLTGCYEMIMKKDTAFLSLALQDTTVTGRLDYHWYEKDRNTGTLKGVLRNDMIYADYTFESEGMTSVREVIFKIHDTTLLQATGELRKQNGKVVYSNTDNLDYDTTNPFIKVACNRLRQTLHPSP